MSSIGVFHQPVDESREIRRHYGNTLIGILRKTFGNTFAPHCAGNEWLGDALHKMDDPSLSRLIRDYDDGRLDGICGR
jgi:hypothetical protein